MQKLLHLGDKIFQSLDPHSRIKCKEVSRTWKSFMKVEKSSYLHTANFFPIKSVVNPRVTRGTPYYTHNYHGDYLLPENPTVSHFSYTCRYSIKKYVYLTCQ